MFLLSLPSEVVLQIIPITLPQSLQGIDRKSNFSWEKWKKITLPACMKQTKLYTQVGDISGSLLTGGIYVVLHHEQDS